MNWAWASSLDQFWRSPAFPMWLTLAAAGFFGIIVLITLLRAEKSVANGALTVITLLAIGIAVAATIRGFGPGSRRVRRNQLAAADRSLPALSCIDDLAGETVLTACEKALFGSAESTAAALSYAAAQITRLTAFGDAATANLTPELQALRRAVERDRYGLMAYVLMARDHCTPSDCAAFRSLTDSQQIVSNMDERIYDGLVMRYSASWNAPPPMAAAAPVAGLAPTDADRQADQCRVSVRGLDPAGQHHDARAARGSRRRARRRWRSAAAVSAPAATPRRPRRQRQLRPRSSRRRNRALGAGSACARRGGARGRQKIDASKTRRRTLNPAACHFISSSLPSAASPSRNSRAGSPNAWRPPRKRACRGIISTSPG